MSSSTPSVGRPRAFDVDVALQKALEVFWRKGYEGTSLPDLTQAMGINKPSLYAAFGNKEQLFLKAVELYEQRPCGFFLPALAQPTAYQVAKFMLLGAAAASANPDAPRGCVVVQGAIACSDSGNAVKQALIAKRQAGTLQLVERFARAQAEGDLAEDADPKALAVYLSTVLQGMAIQATSGADVATLEQIAHTALLVFKK